MPTVPELKSALIAAGFEVYRTRGDVVHVAERVRENLIMDSGVRVRAADASVAFVVRALRSDFPDDSEADLFERARGLGEAARQRGYAEVHAQATPVTDPGDAGRTLDTWCEVSFEKRADSVASAMLEVGFTLSLEKAAGRR